MKNQWTKVKWPFNDDKPYSEWECWQYGQVILYPHASGKSWHYVASFGPNDDRSHSGYLPECETLQAAKDAIQERYARLAAR